MRSLLPAPVIAQPGARLNRKDRRWVLEQVVETILARLDEWDGDADLEPEPIEMAAD